MDRNNKEIIIKMYQSGDTTTKISNYFNVSKTTICRILNDKNIPRNNHLINHKISDEIKKSIINEYLGGETIKKISIKYNLNKNWIRILLKNNLINLRDNAWESKKFKINRNYFNIINDNNAYFLGLIYSDGCLHKNKLSITLISDDSYILKSFADDIFLNDYKLYYKELSNKNHKNICTLIISDKIIVNQLKDKYGLSEVKTLKIRFPKFINDKNLLWNFIQGYFDGDGSISLVKKTRAVVSIVSNDEFCKELNIFFQKNNIKSYIYKKKNGISEIKISEKKSLNILYENLYLNSTLYLKRKKDKFDFFIKNQIKRVKYSKYVGVTFDKSKNKWKSYIYVNNKIINLGYFNNEEDAYNKRIEYEKN